MTGAYTSDGERPPAPGDNDAADLVAQIRQLAGHDPAGVQQVIAEVLAALDRASGGMLRDQLPGGLPLADGADEPPVRPSAGSSLLPPNESPLGPPDDTPARSAGPATPDAG